MNKRILKDSAKLYHFQETVFNQVGVNYPIEFLKASRVAAFYYNGELIGGYIFSKQPNFRVFNSFPHEKAECNLGQFDTHDIAELTGVFYNPPKKGIADSFSFWISLYRDLMKYDCKYFLYAYDLHKSNLGKLYSVARPTILYRGRTKKLKGMMDEGMESIEVIDKDRIRLSLFPISRFFIHKYKRKVNHFIEQRI